jgi:hypothetical protein
MAFAALGSQFAYTRSSKDISTDCADYTDSTNLNSAFIDKS